MDKLKISLYYGVIYKKGSRIMWRGLEDGEIQSAVRLNRMIWRTKRDAWDHYWDEWIN